MNRHEISILSKIGVDDVKVMKKDFKLLEQDVKIFYVVDTFDVIEFCFPTLSNIHEAVENSIASSFLAYNFFFLHNKNKPVILDEYKVELFGMWNELHREANRVLDRQTREKEFEDIKDQLKKDKENLGRNISLVLSLSLGLLSETALLKYKKVLNERLQIDHFETDNENDKFILEEIFNTTYSSERVLSLFDAFCNDAKFVIAGKAQKDKYAYLENAFRDIVVFERITRINEAVQMRTDLQEKYVFLYMSSTPNKSLKIASLFKTARLYTRIYDFPNFPILRNISQFYLEELIQGSTASDKASAKFKMRQLNKCLEILKEGDSRDRLAEKMASSLDSQIDQFNVKINVNRRELENTYLLCNSYYSFRDRIISAVGNDQKVFDNEIKMIVGDLFKEMDRNKNENDRLLLTLNNYKEEFVVQSKLLRYLKAARENKNIFKLVPGHDPVRSFVQLYPVMLFYPNFRKDTFLPLLNFFTEVIQLHIHEISPRHERFVGLKRLDIFRLDSYEQRLYYLFLDLVIPEEGEAPLVENKNNEKNLIIELKKLYAINNKRNASWSLSQNKDTMDVFLFPQRDFEVEVVYFLSWLYRRARSYNDALAYLTRTIDRYEVTDARLLHSRGLCFVSMIYEGLENQPPEYLSWIFQARKDLTDALDLFHADLKSPSKKLLRHVIITIKNTKCDLLTKLFDTDNYQYAYLVETEIRPLLNSFKDDLKNLDEDYNHYPTYNHTEVDVECCEAIVAASRGNFTEAKRKIKHARKRFSLIEHSEALKGYTFLAITGKKVNELYRRYYAGV